MINFLKKLMGDKATRDAKATAPFVNSVKEAYEQISQLSNDELRAKTLEFKQKIQDSIGDEETQIADIKKQMVEQPDMDPNEKEDLYKTIDKLTKQSYDKTEEILNQILPEAFAVIKETARRFKENDVVEVTANEMDGHLASQLDSVNIKDGKAYYDNQWIAGGNTITWDMVHYDVQLFGGVVLHQGKIAEMATGDTLPVYLNALTGKGVHIVTVNDYLAKRDSQWMGMLYQFHGLKVDCIDYHQPNSHERRQAYLADITFGTNNEFGFDYLRDNMTGNPEEMVQRGHPLWMRSIVCLLMMHVHR